MALLYLTAVLLGAADLTSADTTGPTWEVAGALNVRDDPAELRTERVVVGRRRDSNFEAFAMDLQTSGGEPVTSENVPSIDNLRAHSPQTAGESRRQPDTPASNSRSPSRATMLSPTIQTQAIKGESRVNSTRPSD
jgi:hypothetical protein